MKDAYDIIMDLVSEYGLASTRIYSDGKFNGEEYDKAMKIHREICEKVFKVSHKDLKI